MAIEVFNRYEKKYIIDEDTFHKLTYQIADYMNPDAYNRNGEAYRISNIYYDTENDKIHNCRKKTGCESGYIFK